MPQLDVTTWPSQLFWLAITFLALYIVISRIAIPRTGGVIEKRKASSACAQRTGARNVAATKSAFATFHFSERGSVRTDLSRHRNGRPPYRTPRRIAMQNSRN